MKNLIFSWGGTLLLILFLLTIHNTMARTCGQTIISKQNGAFSDASTWNTGTVPSSCDIVIIKNDVTFSGELWIGRDGIGSLRIDIGASLKGSGKLMLINNKSSLVNNGVLELSNFDFGINGTDSAYFTNTGTAVLSGNLFFKKGAVTNKGTMTLALPNPDAIENVTWKNKVNSKTTFTNSVHLNTGATVFNQGYMEVLSTADDALNINTGYFYNCGELKVAGKLNFPSGMSSSKPNLLLNYGQVMANRVYLNSQTTLENWGRLYSTGNIESNGTITNHACAYIEQISSAGWFHNMNNISRLINDGFLKIQGNFKNTNGLVEGSGTVHIKGSSINDGGVISGNLCIYDFSRANPALIVDQNINQATIASTIKVCGSNVEPALCPLSGCGNFSECKAGNDCFDIIYNGYNFIDNGSSVTLKFTVKGKGDANANTCSALSYIAFQLPDGAKKATNPITSNQAYQYGIENPTNGSSNPEIGFYSLKFEAKSNSTELKGSTASNTFSYTLTKEEFISLSNIRVQLKAGTSIFTTEFPVDGCNSSCEPSSVALIGPNAVCNFSDTTFTYRIAQPQAGFTYSFVLPKGLVKVSETASSVSFTAFFLDESQLNQRYPIVVNTTSACGTSTVSKDILVLECGFANPLPVTLTKFEGAFKLGVVNLDWETATEVNNDKFEVERSINGKDFVKIGEVAGNGNSLVARKYTFKDDQPLTGTLYYRLKQTDYDGKYEYSKIIAVDSKVVAGSSSFKATLFPNPTLDGDVSARLEELPLNAREVTLEVIDMSGRRVHTGILPKGSHEVNLGLKALRLRSGVYLVTLSAAGQNVRHRLVVQ